MPQLSVPVTATGSDSTAAAPVIRGICFSHTPAARSTNVRRLAGRIMSAQPSPHAPASAMSLPISVETPAANGYGEDRISHSIHELTCT